MSFKIEEERQRLEDLKKFAAEKAEIEWKSKKQELQRRESEEKELTEKRKRLEEMKKEQERVAENERLLMQEEAEKIKQHEDWLKVRILNFSVCLILLDILFLLQLKIGHLLRIHR